MDFNLASDHEIESALKHPEIWDRITSDSSPQSDEWEISRHGIYLGGYVDGSIVAIMVFHELDDRSGQCHIHTLPEVRKRFAVEFAQGALDWYWKYFDHDRLFAEVPTLYPDVTGFAKKFGFKEVGLKPESFTKSATTYDKVVLMLER